MPARIEILFQKFIDGSCTRQEYDELMNLLQDNQHEASVRQMLQQVYQSAARGLRSVTYVDEQGQLQTGSREETPEPAIIHLQRRSRRKPIAIAATILIIISAGAWYLGTRQKTAKANPAIATAVRKTTQRGELKYLLLPDSTQVWLNVASHLDFPEDFGSDTREVHLTGEAFFDVKHAPDKPFLIHTGNVVTKVLGTAFNIKAYPGQSDIVVSVKRGKVQVSKNNEVMATLLKGQEVKVVTAQTQAPTVNTTGENQVAAWTTGRLAYDGRTIREILDDLERNYNVTIQLAEEALGKEVFTTSFRRDIGVEDALLIICKATHTRLEKKEDRYLITKQ